MITIPFATLNMFKTRFKEICYQRIIKESFEKLLTLIDDELIIDLFNDSYTLDEDFYIIKETVLEADKIILRDNTFDYLYYNWFVGFPKNSDTDIIFYLMFTESKSNFQSDREESKVNLFILASENNYNEGFYIASLLQDIIIRSYEEANTKTYSGYTFSSVTNNQIFSIENDQFLLEVNDKDYYLFKLGFSLVYYKAV